MAHSPESIQHRFKDASDDRVITIDELSALVGLPTAFRKLIDAHIPAEIGAKTAFDSDAGDTQREALYFVPEICRQEDGSVLPYKDFWLQIHINGIPQNPIMGIKFMSLGDDKLDVSMPYLTSIFDSGELYFRPTLGYHIIDSIEALIHNEIKKPLKTEPLFPPPPTAP